VVRARRLLVHELRNDVAVLHLLADREECSARPDAGAPDIVAALDRLRAFLAQSTATALAEPGAG